MNPVTRSLGIKELMNEYVSKATTEEEKNKFLSMQQDYPEPGDVFTNKISEKQLIDQLSSPAPDTMSPREFKGSGKN